MLQCTRIAVTSERLCKNHAKMHCPHGRIDEPLEEALAKKVSRAMKQVGGTKTRVKSMATVGLPIGGSSGSSSSSIAPHEPKLPAPMAAAVPSPESTAIVDIAKGTCQSEPTTPPRAKRAIATADIAEGPSHTEPTTPPTAKRAMLAMTPQGSHKHVNPKHRKYLEGTVVGHGEQGLAKRARPAPMQNSASTEADSSSPAAHVPTQPEPFAADPAEEANARASTLVWHRLTKWYKYPVGIANSVFTALSHLYGEKQTIELFQSEWLADCTDRWSNFGDVIARQLKTQGCNYFQPAVHQADSEYKDLVWALTRFVLANNTLTAKLSQSDAAQLDVLSSSKGLKRLGAAVQNNNCLIDSLFQLLRIHGLAENIDDRPKRCQAVREHLCSTTDTFPRNPDGCKNPKAFLEHSRHAAIIVEQLLDDRRVNRPSLDLVVHARYDTLKSPPDRMRVCDGGDTPCRSGDIVLHLYNYTGNGISGYHYEPLVPG